MLGREVWWKVKSIMIMLGKYKRGKFGSLASALSTNTSESGDIQWDSEKDTARG